MAEWSCPRCTYDNTADRTTCEVCGAERPAPAVGAAPPGRVPVQWAVQIDDARFKQLLLYFNQALQNQGQVAAKYFDALDLDRDGRLSCSEFISGLTRVGVIGMDRSELIKVFCRIEGSDSEVALAPVSSIVSAVTDAPGFIARASPAPAAPSAPSAPPLPAPSAPPPGGAAPPLPAPSAPPPGDSPAFTATAPPLDGAGYVPGRWPGQEPPLLAPVAAPVLAAASAPPAAAADPEPTAPPAPSPIIVYDAKELARCAWLAAEALRIEARAAEFDRGGSVAEALFHHRLATLKLAEAAAACPDQHPDKSKLEEHSTDITFRMVYLESLGAAAPTLPLEEHVPEIELTMDLSSAQAPQEEAQDIAGLVAQTGASGSTSALTEDGYQLVAALKSNDEMKVYVGRILGSGGRRVRAGAEAEFEVFVPLFSGVGQIQSFTRLQEALFRSTWAELVLDPKKDKLELAMDLEKEARRFQGLGIKDEAVNMFKKSTAILQFVVNRDERMKNPKIKEMVTKRMEDMQVQSAQLQLQL